MTAFTRDEAPSLSAGKWNKITDSHFTLPVLPGLDENVGYSDVGYSWLCLVEPRDLAHKWKSRYPGTHGHRLWSCRFWRFSHQTSSPAVSWVSMHARYHRSEAVEGALCRIREWEITTKTKIKDEAGSQPDPQDWKQEWSPELAH